MEPNGMPEQTPQPQQADRRGPILFGLMAFGVLAPHVFGLAVSLWNGGAAPPIQFVRPILWGVAVFLLYLGYLGVRWLILAGVVLGAATLGWQAAAMLQAGYPVAAADFAALALAQIGGGALLFGSRTLRDWLAAQRARRLGRRIE
jgi:hypothetical protein